MKIVDKSLWRHPVNGFQIQKFEKNWQENAPVGLENDRSGIFVLFYE